MTWNDHYRRRDALEAAVEHARTHPSDRPGPDTVPAARGVFEDADDLLCALQHRWTQLLTGRLDLAAGESGEDGHFDRLTAVRVAWQRTAEANPGLRALLDDHVEPAQQASSPRLREAVARELRMLARAGGLVEPFDDGDDIARIGSTVRRLIQLPRTATGARTPKLLAGSR